jgi:hypothetical protein
MLVNGKDYPIYEMENKIHVWNHQPDNYPQLVNIGGYSWNNINVYQRTVFTGTIVQVDIGSQTSTQEATILVTGLSG